MMNFLIVICFIVSILFMFLNHPLSFGFMLLMQTIIITMITGMMNHNYWYSYILFLVMIGGMLILFIYMTSIASNEKFKFSMKLFMLFIIMMFFSLILINLDSFFLNYLVKNNETTYFNMKLNNSLSLMKFMNFPNNMILFMIFIYLFITLIAVTKICDKSMGPLRQKF
uniref:NADH-ubiquinone oxidoreductase chain 6 n=1 Tax=Teucriogethes sp. TaxID=3123426 RepID=A0AAN0LHH6_9CUCU